MTYKSNEPAKDWEFNSTYNQQIDIFGEMPPHYEIYADIAADTEKYQLLDQSTDKVYKFNTRKELITFIVENSCVELYFRNN